MLVDPSHAAGLREFVPQHAMAGIAAGADGIIVEVHPEPAKALSDGRQSLTPEGFKTMVDRMRPMALAMGRRIQ